MEYFSVKNWEKHQHYKDRNPPWIKLHKDLLHDYEFTCLQDASKLHLMLIWILASQMENKIPVDGDWLKNTLHTDTEIDLKALSDAGFIDIDSSMLATCEQSAMLETEAQVPTEAESETKKDMSTFTLEIFEFWKTTMSHPRSKLDDKRKRLIKAALKTGYSANDCKQAILGCSYTPWNMGINPDGQKFDSLELILRNAEKIDWFIANEENPPKPQNDAERRYLSNVQAAREAMDMIGDQDAR